MMKLSEKDKRVAGIAGAGVGAFGLVSLLIMGLYVVDEGHVGIVKRWGEVVRQDAPGLHFKLPIRDTVEEIDVRARKSEESMATATSEQMPAQAELSFNWAVDATAAIDVYKKYGGLPQFEERILDPMMRSTAKAAISTFTAEQIIQNRIGVIAKIEDGILARVSKYAGVSVDSVQLEDIKFPDQYTQSIQRKQRAKNEADQAVQDLRRQETESRQVVNTANARRDADKALADGLAYSMQVQSKAEAEAIRIRGIAEADALKAQAEVLRSAPNLVDYVRARGWDGVMPTTVMGGEASVLWQSGEQK